MLSTWQNEVKRETSFPITSTAAHLYPLHHHPPSLFCKYTQKKKAIYFPEEKPRQALLNNSLWISFNHCVLFHHVFLEFEELMHFMRSPTK